MAGLDPDAAARSSALPVRSDPQQQHRDHRLVFRLQLALGACGLAAVVAAVATAADSVHRGPAGTHRVVIGGQHFSYPAVNVAAIVLLLLAALGAAVTMVALRASWGQLRGYRRFIREIGVIGTLPGHPAVNVIDASEPQAFCAGWLRPRVYVSRGTLEILSQDELRAVLAHEHHHRRARDPLRLACTRVLSQALFFLPALHPLRDRYSDLAELDADEAAVVASAGEKAPLASALLAFDAASPPGVAGVSSGRVDQLLGRPVGWRLPTSLIAVSLAAVSALIVVIWRASEVASANATFNLPILSSQPCMLVLALLPLGGMLVAIAGRGRLVGRTRLLLTKG
jgi:hypothetical protein